MGDVVAVRHDSGDGVLRYTPVWVKSVSYDLGSFTTNISGKLYLSAAWDHRVQAIEPILTTTLNPNFAITPPEPVGTTGGYTNSSPQKIVARPGYNFFDVRRYSPEGEDKI